MYEAVNLFTLYFRMQLVVICCIIIVKTTVHFQLIDRLFFSTLVYCSYLKPTGASCSPEWECRAEFIVSLPINVN